MDQPTEQTSTVPTTTTTEATSTDSSLIAEAKAPTSESSPEVVPPAEPAKEPEAAKEPEFVFKAEDLKIPEGFTVDEAARDDFVKLANEHKISPQTAEALVGLQAKLVQQSADASVKVWTDMQTTWRNEVKSNPEIGGEKLEGVLSGIGKLIDQYGSNEFREVMTLTGAGNNVHVVSFLNKIASQLVEPAPVSGGPISGKTTLADSLYNTMKK